MFVVFDLFRLFFGAGEVAERICRESLVERACRGANMKLLFVAAKSGDLLFDKLY